MSETSGQIERNGGVVEHWELLSKERPAPPSEPESEDGEAYIELQPNDAFSLWVPGNETKVTPLYSVYQGANQDGEHGLWLRFDADRFVMPVVRVVVEYDTPEGFSVRQCLIDPFVHERIAERRNAAGLAMLDAVNGNRRLLGLEPQTPESAGLTAEGEGATR